MIGRQTSRHILPMAGAVLLWACLIVQAPAQVPQGADRPAEYDVIVDRDVMIRMRDGVRLAADVYHPARGDQPAPGRFPTLMTRTPYNKGAGNSDLAKWYASRGYSVVMNDVRGRYASEGAWRMIVDDPKDGVDVVRWIASQPWSDGKVGTFGTSYSGGTQHALAEMNPDQLTTMVPVDALSNCGVSGIRHGGAFELRFANWIFQIGAPNAKKALENEALRASLVESGRRIREHLDNLPIEPGTTPLRVVPEYESWLVDALRSGPDSDFWKIKGMSVVDNLDDYKDIPVLHVTGWYDSWTRQVTMNYEALAKTKKSPQRLLIGPWTHGGQGSNRSGEVEFTPEAALDMKQIHLRWYDHWMKGEVNGVDSDPPVMIYVMGVGDDHKTRGGRLNHGGYWRREREWPLRRASATSYYLHDDGSLSTEKPIEKQSADSYTFDPKHPVPTVGGNISSSGGLMTNGGFDQRPRDDTHAAAYRLPLSERADVLVFRTDPLPADLEVTGTVEVNLFVSSDAPDTDFTAKLIDEIPPNQDYPLGFDLNIGDSIVRARYRESLEKVSSPLKPGVVVPVTIRLYPTSNLFKKGHRLRVDVSSSNYPRFDVNPNTGDPLGQSRRWRTAENTIHHDAEHPSSVVLPVVPPGL